MIFAGILVKGPHINNIEGMKQKGSVHIGTIHKILAGKIPIAIVTSMRLGIITVLDIVKTNVTRTHI